MGEPNTGNIPQENRSSHYIKLPPRKQSSQYAKLPPRKPSSQYAKLPPHIKSGDKVKGSESQPQQVQPPLKQVANQVNNYVSLIGLFDTKTEEESPVNPAQSQNLGPGTDPGGLQVSTVEVLTAQPSHYAIISRNPNAPAPKNQEGSAQPPPPKKSTEPKGPPTEQELHDLEKHLNSVALEVQLARAAKEREAKYPNMSDEQALALLKGILDQMDEDRNKLIASQLEMGVHIPLDKVMVPEETEEMDVLSKAILALQAENELLKTEMQDLQSALLQGPVPTDEPEEFNLEDMMEKERQQTETEKKPVSNPTLQQRNDDFDQMFEKLQIMEVGSPGTVRNFPPQAIDDFLKDLGQIPANIGQKVVTNDPEVSPTELPKVVTPVAQTSTPVPQASVPATASSIASPKPNDAGSLNTNASRSTFRKRTLSQAIRKKLHIGNHKKAKIETTASSTPAVKSKKSEKTDTLEKFKLKLCGDYSSKGSALQARLAQTISSRFYEILADDTYDLDVRNAMPGASNQRKEKSAICISLAYSKRVRQWSMQQILSEKNPDKRMKIAKNLFETAWLLKEQGNLQGAAAIYGALISTSVRRLACVKALVDDSRFIQIDKLINIRKKAAREWEESMIKSSEPFIPFFENMLTHMEFNELEPDRVANEVKLLEKMRENKPKTIPSKQIIRLDMDLISEAAKYEGTETINGKAVKKEVGQLARDYKISTQLEPPPQKQSNF